MNFKKYLITAALLICGSHAFAQFGDIAGCHYARDSVSGSVIDQAYTRALSQNYAFDPCSGKVASALDAVTAAFNSGGDLLFYTGPGGGIYTGKTERRYAYGFASMPCSEILGTQTTAITCSLSYKTRSTIDDVPFGTENTGGDTIVVHLENVCRDGKIVYVDNAPVGSKYQCFPIKDQWLDGGGAFCPRPNR